MDELCTTAKRPRLWIPQPWLDEIEHVEREYEIEHAHASRLHHDLWDSGVVRSLVESPDPGPRRAWLCFLALVDLYLDPMTPGLPLPSIHPPRLRVPPGWVFTTLVEPWRYGFERGGTPAGRARTNVVKRLRARGAKLRHEGERLSAQITAEEASLNASCWVGEPSGRWRDDAPMHFEEFRDRTRALLLRRAEVRALAKAASAIEETARQGPMVYEPESGDVREGPPAFIALLEFTLGTDPTLTKPEREALIGAVLGDFFPRTLADSAQAPQEYVRTTLKDMRRRADKAQKKADNSKNDPQGAIATYACTQLLNAGVIGPWSEREVARSPNGRGVRVVFEVPPRG